MIASFSCEWSWFLVFRRTTRMEYFDLTLLSSPMQWRWPRLCSFILMAAIGLLRFVCFSWVSHLSAWGVHWETILLRFFFFEKCQNRSNGLEQINEQTKECFGLGTEDCNDKVRFRFDTDSTTIMPGFAELLLIAKTLASSWEATRLPQSTPGNSHSSYVVASFL